MITTYRKILASLHPRERRRFLSLIAMVLVMAMLDLIGVASIMPFLAVVAQPDAVDQNPYMAYVYNYFEFQSTNEFMIVMGVCVFFLVIGSLTFKALTTYALLRFSTMRNYTLARRLMEGYLRQPYVWFLRKHSADLGSKVLSEVDNVVGRTITPACKAIAHAVVLAAIVCLLFIVNPVVTVGAAAFFAFGYGLLIYVARTRLLRLGRIRVEANHERFRVAQEAIGGIKDVKLLGLEKDYMARFRPPAERFARTQATGAVLAQVPRFALEALAFGAILGFVIFLLVQGGETLETILPLVGLYAFAGLRMLPEMQQLYAALTAMRFGRPGLDSLHAELEALALSPKQSRVDGPAIVPTKRVELVDVTYRYPGAERAAVEGLTLAFDSGSKIGLVGGTGAGKTTVVDIMLGLLEPNAGSLKVDGCSVEPSEMRRWQESIGYVPQHIFLVDDTIAANVAFGVAPEEIDHAAVERAARLAELHTFVMEELPQGYATTVGEQGVRLSGGQRQRIGIARALYREPRLLILDEATSALDNLTEQAVMRAIDNLPASTTVVMIAHRLSTVRRCDRIFMLRNGRVAATGTYEELLQDSSDFRALAAASA